MNHTEQVCIDPGSANPSFRLGARKIDIASSFGRPKESLTLGPSEFQFSDEAIEETSVDYGSLVSQILAEQMIEDSSEPSAQ